MVVDAYSGGKVTPAVAAIAPVLMVMSIIYFMGAVVRNWILLWLCCLRSWAKACFCIYHTQSSSGFERAS